MRIVLLTDTLGDLNGVSRFVSQTARFASITGVDLHVVTSTNRVVPAGENIFNIAPRLSAPLPGYAELSLVWPRNRAVRERVGALSPDVIHVSTPGPMGVLGRKLAREMNVPLVGTYHTDFPQYAERLLGDEALGQLAARIGRWFYAPFDRVLVRSRAYIEPVRALGIDAGRVHALRPGIDTGAFYPRSGPRDPSRPLNVLYCGRVSVEKGLDLLAPIWLLASEQLRARNIEATLTIVGGGPYRDSLKAQLADPRVRFTGVLHGADLLRAYHAADVLLFPSTTDTLGQVVLEAQACGIPAIVSDLGGPATVVEHDRTGVVVASHNPQHWARALVELLENESRRSAMGTSAAMMMREFTFERSLLDFAEHHRQVLAARQNKMRKPTPMAKSSSDR